MSSLIDILNEWQTNLKFREEFKKDPEQALNEAGFTLSPKDLKKIKSVLKFKEEKTKNEKLDDRINK